MKKKIQILKFIRKFVKKNKYPPTLWEIAYGVELKTVSGVHQHLVEMGIDWTKIKKHLLIKCPYCKRDL